MDRAEYTAWLSGLSAGDEVCILSGYRAEVRLPATVERITPTGRIAVRAVTRRWEFNADGAERGGGRSYRAKLRPLTQEVRDQLEQRALSARLKQARWEELPLESLRQHAALLEKGASWQQFRWCRFEDEQPEVGVDVLVSDAFKGLYVAELSARDGDWQDWHWIRDGGSDLAAPDDLWQPIILPPKGGDAP